MSYHDPSDPRTRRYESGYGQSGSGPDPRAYSQNPNPGYYDDPTYRTPAADHTYRQPAEHAYRPAENAYRPPVEPHHVAEPARPRRRPVGPDINPGLFAGGVVMSGVVTGLAAWLVAWIIRTLVQRINEVGSLGIWNPVARDEIWFALVGFLCALAGGALWYVLQMITPSPDQFYRWIVGLLIIAAAVIPLLLSAEVSVGIATAVLHLVIGIPVFVLIPAMGQKSRSQR